MIVVCRFRHVYYTAPSPLNILKMFQTFFFFVDFGAHHEKLQSSGWSLPGLHVVQIDVRDSVHDSVHDLKHAPLFERCLAGCESQNGHQKDMCWEEIRVHNQKIVNHLDAIVNIIGETYISVNNWENIHFDSE